MMEVYWDSCVFFCYLTGQPANLWADVSELANDAKNKKLKIHTSTMTFAEVRQSALRKGGYPALQDFFADFQNAFFPLDPNPNIMIAAGELKSAEPVNPSDANPPNKRVIGTADAIHLMTCLYLRDVIGIKDIVFNTFDDGKGKTWEGKCVPLLSFERWFPAGSRTDRVADVCSLKRIRPQHPEPKLWSMPDAAPINPQPRH